MAAMYMCLTGSGPASRALSMVEDVGAAGLAFGDPGQGYDTTAAVATVQLLCDDPGPSLYQTMWPQSAAAGRVLQAAFTRAAASQVSFRRGALLDAEADARAAWEIFAPFRATPTAMYWWSLAALLQVLLARGLLEEAAALIAATGLERAAEDIVMVPWPPVLRGQLALAQGQTESAVDLLLDTGAWLEERGFANPALIPWRAIVAPALVECGRPDDARTVIGSAVEQARAFGAPWALGMALRTAGSIDRGSAGIALLEDAVEVLERSPCRLEHARALLELGAALRRANQRANARKLLQSALVMLRGCGASPLAERALQELAATGARPRRLLLSGVESLTASEHRVAQLAASGLSNREIAHQLFVTRKTVESHLGHVYTKLDIGSRKDLPMAMNS